MVKSGDYGALGGVFVIGFRSRWLGQLISLLNWDLAKRLGLREKELLPEYKLYEHAIAVADTAMAWLYGVAAIGLILDTEWDYKLSWIPGSILFTTLEVRGYGRLIARLQATDFGQTLRESDGAVLMLLRACLQFLWHG